MFRKEDIFFRSIGRLHSLVDWWKYVPVSLDLRGVLLNSNVSHRNLIGKSKQKYKQKWPKPSTIVLTI